MSSTEPHHVSSWWTRRSGLEQIAVLVLAVGGIVTMMAVLAPALTSAAVGGALTAVGTLFLRKAFT